MLTAVGVLAVVIGWGTWWIAAGVVAILLAICSFVYANDI
ncbi:hypothetical protein SAMN05421854_11936 [Amycolatopsis rubida]|uniref:Uncharacterized protein n=1 Tax=Amycolatopsis rubida TaxID=112413 RepID=A0A1I6AI27_9PSEU|nr:hypothetical protein SAMN05421854_11936 [Amycolatopsis rubida]